MNNIAMSNAKPKLDSTLVPLYVDLDGTLIKSDLLYESFFALIKKNLFYIFWVPFWIVKGKAFLKYQIAKRAQVDTSLLPYNATLLAYLRAEKEKGRSLVLATASNEKYAREIADHLKIFSHVLASSESCNMSSTNKLKEIKKDCGDGNFDYAGNSNADVSIFSEARKSILVNPLRGVKQKTHAVAQEYEVMCEDKTGLMVLLKTIRVHQWLKNLLIFVPVLTSHSWAQFDLLWPAGLAFIAFSLCASSVYVLNDLLDLPSDRRHVRKKSRAFASGEVPIQLGLPLIILLIVVGLLIGGLVSLEFLLVLLCYLMFTLAYSTVLKTYVLLDVFMLAGLYTFRIVAGAVAINVALSFWLLAFSIFFFLSLALVKRCAELISIHELDKNRISGRDYAVDDLHQLRSMGVASGYLSVFVIAFYINSTEVISLYSHPQLLWFIAPVLLYWLSRMWLKTGRGEMHDDPLVYSVGDTASQIIALFIFAVVFFAA